MSVCFCLLGLGPFPCDRLGSCHVGRKLQKAKLKAQTKEKTRSSGRAGPPSQHWLEVWCPPSLCQWSVALCDALILVRLTQDRIDKTQVNNVWLYEYRKAMRYGKLTPTLLEDWGEKVIPVVVTVQAGVVSEEGRRRGFGHADAILVRRLVFELVLVIPITCGNQ